MTQQEENRHHLQLPHTVAHGQNNQSQQSLQSKRGNLVGNGSIMASGGDSSIQENLLNTTEMKGNPNHNSVNKVPKYHGKYINLLIEYEEVQTQLKTVQNDKMKLELQVLKYDEVLSNEIDNTELQNTISKLIKENSEK